MPVTYDFSVADLMMSVGGHLFILVMLIFILLLDVKMISFPSKNVKEMIQNIASSSSGSSSK
jgi:flagellar biogenesis protein FliO